MHAANVSASFRHGMTMDNSTGLHGDPAAWAAALSVVGSQLILVIWCLARVVLAGTVRVELHQMPDERWVAPPHLQAHRVQFSCVHPLQPLPPGLCQFVLYHQRVFYAALPDLLRGVGGL